MADLTIIRIELKEEMRNRKPLIPKSKIKLEAEELKSKCQSSVMTPENLLKQLREFHSFHVEQIDNEITTFLYLVKDWRPRVICEIGTYYGGSLFLLSQVCPDDALLISIDIDSPRERQRAYQDFVRGKQTIRCIKGDTSSEKTLNKVVKILKGKSIDLLFIDGDHSFLGVANDFVRYAPLVRPGGFVAFHDINNDTYLKTGIRSTTNVGEVPIFWGALKQTFSKVIEIINDPDQDGYGIGIIQVN